MYLWEVGTLNHVTVTWPTVMGTNLIPPNQICASLSVQNYTLYANHMNIYVLAMSHILANHSMIYLWVGGCTMRYSSYIKQPWYKPNCHQNLIFVHWCYGLWKHQMFCFQTHHQTEWCRYFIHCWQKCVIWSLITSLCSKSKVLVWWTGKLITKS